MVAYSFKKRFVEPIRRGLVSAYPTADGIRPKRQTIRAHGKRRHARPGETLQLYCAMRTKACFKINEARCASVSNVVIWIGANDLTVMTRGRLLKPRALNAFARDDGFADWRDMHAFWRENHRNVEKFEGVLIQWDPL